MPELLSGPLILASASPRRRDLLAAAGIPCVVRPASVEEVPLPGEAPADYVQRLAKEKNLAVAAADGALVLAADTVVVAGGRILEKPVDADDAARMLAALSGRWHQVMTGFCLRRGNRVAVGVEETAVHFAEMAAEDIAGYVATGEPMDKAGAYAIQGIASRWVDRIEGCYFNVVGLPIPRVWRELAHFHATRE